LIRFAGNAKEYEIEAAMIGTDAGLLVPKKFRAALYILF